MTHDWKESPQFETLNGSRLYGIDTSNSDWDFMGAVIEPPEYVIGLLSFEQHEWKKPDHRHEGVTYSLRKYIKLLKDGNPSVLCTMFSPIAFDTLGITTEEFQKMVVSAKAGPKFAGYMKSQMQRLESGSGMHVTREPNQYGYDSKYAGHIIRLGYQGIEYLETGRITLPIEGLEHENIMTIRNGEMPWNDFLWLATFLDEDLQRAIESCTLPPEPQHDQLNEWLVETYRKHW